MPLICSNGDGATMMLYVVCVQNMLIAAIISVGARISSPYLYLYLYKNKYDKKVLRKKWKKIVYA